MPPRKKSPSNTVSGNIEGIVLQNVSAEELHVQQVRREATPQEQRDQEAQAARARLRLALQEKFADWQAQTDRLPSAQVNPYRFLTPLGPAEAGRLAGRASEVERVLQVWQVASTQFLSGADGMGKTSFILAGLIPSLLRAGHLPLYVQASHLPLDVSIKRQLLPDLSVQPFLRDLPLAAFLHEVGNFLPRGRHLYVLVDRFEIFCGQPEPNRQAFKDEWALAVSGTGADVCWLFCVQASHIHVLNFFAPQVQPFSLLVVLSPLDRQAGSEILLGAAGQARLQVEPALLEALLDDWQKEMPDPLRLQLAAHSLAGGGSFLSSAALTLAEYERRGRLPGILRSYLEQSMQELPLEDRKPAWQILSALLENGGAARLDDLQGHLKSEGVAPADFEHIAEILRVKHILCLEDDSYRLSSASLNARIEQWQAGQAARQQVRQEFRRQMQHIRGSALRGLLGGGLMGFPVFAVLAYPGDLLAIGAFFLVFFILLAATVGGLAGLLITMGVDVVLAVYPGSRRLSRHLIAALGGGLTMWFAVFAYLALFASPRPLSDLLLQTFPPGAPWGALLGAGIVQAKTGRASLGVAALTSLLCGGVLTGLEAIFGLLGAYSPFLVGLGGAWFSLCMAVVSLLGRHLPAGGET